MEEKTMACFTVPMAEAIIVTIIQKVVEKNEKKDNPGVSLHQELDENPHTGFRWSRKLGWLKNLLWGGVFLLAIEHIWHGEVVPWPPFLTAMNNPADIAPMLHEIATIGTAMALFVTLVWGIMVLIADKKAKAFPSEAKPAAKIEI
jgi:hypothetical protein